MQLILLLPLLAAFTFADNNGDLAGVDVKFVDEIPAASDRVLPSNQVLEEDWESRRVNPLPANAAPSAETDEDDEDDNSSEEDVPDINPAKEVSPIDVKSSSLLNKFKTQDNSFDHLIENEVIKSRLDKRISDGFDVPPPDNLMRPLEVHRPTPGCRNCFEWTRWMSADDPNGIGDVETLGPPNKYNVSGTISKKFPLAACSYPVRMECREAMTRIPWHMIKDNRITYKCKPFPGEGFLCLNSHQDQGNTCRDYETRLLCLKECSCFKWTRWIDASDPRTEEGDFEVVGRTGYPALRDPCRGRAIVDVQCRRSKDKVNVAKASDRNVRCTLFGLTCYNRDQRGKKSHCDNYEVRFLCQQNLKD